MSPFEKRGERLWEYAMVVGVIGLILSVVGLFLPWGTYPGAFGEATVYYYDAIGLETDPRSVLIGCIVTIISLFFLLTGLIRIAPALMAAGGFFIIGDMSSWILDFRRWSVWHQFAVEGVIVERTYYPAIVLYGAYVTLAGGIIIVTAAVLSAVHAIRRKETVRNIVEEYKGQGKSIEEAREKPVRCGLDRKLVERFIQEILEG